MESERVEVTKYGVAWQRAQTRGQNITRMVLVRGHEVSLRLEEPASSCMAR